MNRADLALAACQGLTDAELADRGPQGFKKMIERKRKYATAARILTVGTTKLSQELKIARQRIADLEKQVATYQSLEKLDSPIDDTTQAASLLANLGKK